MLRTEEADGAPNGSVDTALRSLSDVDRNGLPVILSVSRALL